MTVGCTVHLRSSRSRLSAARDAAAGPVDAPAPAAAAADLQTVRVIVIIVGESSSSCTAAVTYVTVTVADLLWLHISRQYSLLS